jgi:hypothetical protein
MKTKILFPNRFKRIGGIILIPSAILGILAVLGVISFDFMGQIKVFAFFSDDFPGDSAVFGLIHNNISDEILGILCILGGIMVAFSKEKHEDEFIAKIRMDSLIWATYVNYAILLFCMLFFYNIGFLYVMIFNMFTILLFFILRFYYMLYKSKQSMRNEK